MAIFHYEQRAMETKKWNVPVAAFRRRRQPAVDGAGCELGYLLLTGPRVSLHQSPETGCLT